MQRNNRLKEQRIWEGDDVGHWWTKIMPEDFKRQCFNAIGWKDHQRLETKCNEFTKCRRLSKIVEITLTAWAKCCCHRTYACV